MKQITVSLDKAEEGIVHYLPVDVEYEGSAPVDAYFGCKVVEGEPLRSSLFGRRLTGAQRPTHPLVCSLTSRTRKIKGCI